MYKESISLSSLIHCCSLFITVREKSMSLIPIEAWQKVEVNLELVTYTFEGILYLLEVVCKNMVEVDVISGT